MSTSTTHPAESDLPPHPGLTIRVYRIDTAGNRTTIRERTTLQPAPHPMETSKWPPCGCPIRGCGA